MRPYMQAGSELPVTVIDPGADAPAARRLRVNAQGVASLSASVADADSEAAGYYLSPGWVDLHAHVFDGSTQISVRPDRVGLDQGVHLVADAGSAGEATVRGLADYVIPASRTKVAVWLNIGSHGLVHLKEVSRARFIDVDRTIAAVQRMPDLIRGIKVRSSGAIVDDMGLQPLKLGRLVARECGIPLLVHIGEAPPIIDDVLDALDDGDTVTHCFHGKTGYPWLPDGQPTPALRRALDRGVRLDVGHGAASFSVDVARRAVDAGYSPTTISTDIHVRNVDGPVHSLASVMTKMLYCGMPLDAIIRAVTTAPRQTLRLPEQWLDPDRTIRSATLFSITEEQPPYRYIDSTGNAFQPDRHITPIATVVDGRVGAPIQL